MSSSNDAEFYRSLENLESCGSENGNSPTAEAGDVKGCIEKLSQLGTVRVPIFEEDEAREWLKRIQAVSKVTWRVIRNDRGERRNVFKTLYRCQHNVPKNKELTGKNTKCPARLHLILKRTKFAKGAKSRAKDVLASSHPLIASLQGEHNHPIEAAASLKYRDVSEDVQQQLKDLFAAGHSPSSAYDLLHCQMMANDPGSYVFNAADRHNLPDLHYCYRLYYKVCRAERTEAPSSSCVAGDSDRHSDASYTQHVPEKGFQASEDEVPYVCPDFQQGSDARAAQDNEHSEVIEKHRNNVAWLRAFIDQQEATPEGLERLSAMATAMQRLGTGPALLRAMHSFSRRTVPSLRAKKSCATIGVQPIAVARRKVPLGGRKRIHAGRPVSAAQSAARLLQVAKRRKAPAPQLLSQCVQSISSLGKSY